LRPNRFEIFSKNSLEIVPKKYEKFSLGADGSICVIHKRREHGRLMRD